MRKINSFILLALVATIFSCTKDEIIGSEIVKVSGPVEVVDSLRVSDDSIDFALGERPYFTAKFKNDAYWELTLTSGGAYKTIKGGTTEISALNSVWDGSSDVLYSFKPGNVQATLSFPKSSNNPVFSTSFYIKSKPNLNSKGLLVTDFSSAPITGPDSPILWPSDWQPTGQYDGTGTPPTGGEAMGKYPVIDLLDGTSALIMAGTPWGQGPYIDFVDISARSINANWSTFPLVPEVNRVYFNFFMYHDDSTMSKMTSLQVTLFDENQLAVTFTVVPKWRGWNLVSVNMGDLIKSANQTTESYTPINFKTHKISKISYVLLSTVETSTEPVKTIIDHIHFTYDKPFQP